MSDKLANVLTPELRSVVRKDCPLFEGSWVDFYDDINVDDVRNAQKVASNPEAIDENLRFIANQIKDWNFADAEGKKLPISVEGIGKLSMKLLGWLARAQWEVLEAMGKEDLERKKKAGEGTDLKS